MAQAPLLARALGLGLVLVLSAPALAQAPSARGYLQQCLTFEAEGDLETARLSCETALQLEPQLRGAELALGRIELALGEEARAERRFRGLVGGLEGDEARLLLAQVMLRQNRLGEAENLLAAAMRQGDLESRRLFLLGRVAEGRGDYEGALGFYRAAISASPVTEAYHLASARLRLRLGDPFAAQGDLFAYLQSPSGQESAELLSLLGHATWAAGDLSGAARFLERALDARSAREVEALERDRRALVLVYFGQGDWSAGRLVLASALRRDDLPGYLLSFSLPWLLLLLALLGLHLFGESRLEAGSSLARSSEPETVGSLYGGLALAFVVASFATLAYGYFVLGNWLALVTPWQSADARACYLAVLAVVLFAFAWRRLKRSGLDPLDTLLGKTPGIVLGLSLGLALLALAIVYLHYAPEIAWLRGFYLDYAHLNLWLVAAVVLFPLAELFFRGYALPALEHRYSPALAVAIAAILYALPLGLPLPLLVAIGLLLGAAYRRTRSGLTSLVAQWTLHLGLLLGTAYSGWLRSLFI
jgi:membrane protease YdiL (CAAX protease family)